MVVVPARYSVLQVAFDLLQKRDAVLVSYQGDASTVTPTLHAWNGREWVYISFDDYAHANFVQVVPTQVVLVGGEDLLPESLVTASSWCPLVMNVPAVDTATLVNSFGKTFRFRESDWQWFSSRYNLELADLNAERRRESWYDQPFYDVPRVRARESVGPSSLQPVDLPPAVISSPDALEAPEYESVPAMDDAGTDVPDPQAAPESLTPPDTAEPAVEP